MEIHILDPNYYDTSSLPSEQCEINHVVLTTWYLHGLVNATICFKDKLVEDELETQMKLCGQNQTKFAAAEIC